MEQEPKVKDSCPVDPNANPNVGRWWKHRRKLCYMAFYWSIAQTILLAAVALVDPNALIAMGAVVGWSYGLCATIVMGYYGNTAIEEHKRKPE